MPIEADRQASSTVTDHPFVPSPVGLWALCVTCGLSEAAHRETEAEYAPALPYRCPYCVNLGTDPCHHGHQDALDIHGKLLNPCPACGGQGVMGGPDADGNYDPCDACDGSGTI